jgi:hypothetical protein
MQPGSQRGVPVARSNAPQHGHPSPVPGLRADTDIQNILNIAVQSSTSRRDFHAPILCQESPRYLTTTSPFFT